MLRGCMDDNNSSCGLFFQDWHYHSEGVVARKYHGVLVCGRMAGGMRSSFVDGRVAGGVRNSFVGGGWRAMRETVLWAACWSHLVNNICECAVS